MPLSIKLMKKLHPYLHIQYWRYTAAVEKKANKIAGADDNKF